jgi:hypothetical protein
VKPYDDAAFGTLISAIESGEVRIIRADPHIRVSDGLLSSLPCNHMFLDWPALTFTDDFGAKFIYQITSYDLRTNSWEARWPD